jgi:hypothetical protein
MAAKKKVEDEAVETQEEVKDEAPVEEAAADAPEAPEAEVEAPVEEEPVVEIVADVTDETAAAVENAHKNQLRVIRAQLQAQIDAIDAELA